MPSVFQGPISAKVLVGLLTGMSTSILTWVGTTYIWHTGIPSTLAPLVPSLGGALGYLVGGHLAKHQVLAAELEAAITQIEGLHTTLHTTQSLHTGVAPLLPSTAGYNVPGTLVVELPTAQAVPNGTQVSASPPIWQTTPVVGTSGNPSVPFLREQTNLQTSSPASPQSPPSALDLNVDSVPVEQSCDSVPPELLG